MALIQYSLNNHSMFIEHSLSADFEFTYCLHSIHLDALPFHGHLLLDGR